MWLKALTSSIAFLAERQNTSKTSSILDCFLDNNLKLLTSDKEGGFVPWCLLQHQGMRSHTKELQASESAIISKGESPHYRDVLGWAAKKCHS